VLTVIYRSLCVFVCVYWRLLSLKNICKPACYMVSSSKMGLSKVWSMVVKIRWC